MSDRTLRTALEAAWNHPEVRCPSHLVRWNTREVGHTRLSDLGLWWTRGTRRGPVIPRSQSRKLHSYLPKNYGLAWRVKSNIIQKEGLLPLQ